MGRVSIAQVLPFPHERQLGRAREAHGAKIALLSSRVSSTSRPKTTGRGCLRRATIGATSVPGRTSLTQCHWKMKWRQSVCVCGMMPLQAGGKGTLSGPRPRRGVEPATARYLGCQDVLPICVPGLCSRGRVKMSSERMSECVRRCVKRRQRCKNLALCGLGACIRSATDLASLASGGSPANDKCGPIPEPKGSYQPFDFQRFRFAGKGVVPKRSGRAEPASLFGR